MLIDRENDRGQKLSQVHTFSFISLLLRVCSANMMRLTLGLTLAWYIEADGASAGSSAGPLRGGVASATTTATAIYSILFLRRLFSFTRSRCSARKLFFRRHGRTSKITRLHSYHTVVINCNLSPRRHNRQVFIWAQFNCI